MRVWTRLGWALVAAGSLLVLVSASSQPTTRPVPSKQTQHSSTKPATPRLAPTSQVSQYPLLYQTAHLIAERIHWQESRKDATCWTTVRMMEHFYARKALTPQAAWLKIEATKLLMYQLWRKASQLTKHAALLEKDIERINPPLLKASLRFLGKRQIPASSSLFQRVKLRDYHKVTENWRMLLSIAMDSFVGEGVFAHGYVDVKPLSSSAAMRLANLSTALTIALLQEANKAAKLRKHRDIEVPDVKQAYTALLQKLGLKKGKSTSSFRVRISDKERGYQLLRSLTLKVMRGKVKALRSWNKRVWKKKNTETRLLSLLQQLTTMRLTRRDLRALVRYLKRTFLPFSLGATVRESVSQVMPSLGLQHSGTGIFRRARSGQAPVRPRYIRFLWMANNLESLFPFQTRHNGDVVFRFIVQADEAITKPSTRPSQLPPMKEKVTVRTKRMITGPDLDAIRDTTVHWFALLQLWESNQKSSAIDPFAGEILSERASELALFLIREAEARAKRIAAKTGAKTPPKHALEEYLKKAFVLFTHSKQTGTISAWNAKRQQHKMTLMKQYKHKLFAELPRAKLGLAAKSCALPKSWVDRYRLEPLSVEQRKKIDPRKKDRTHLGIQVWMGSGFAVGDYDNDGKVDLFFAGEGCNRLYRNLGQYRFKDVTQEVGLQGLEPHSKQALFVDVNNDRRLDLFVLHSVKPARLFLQTAQGKFVDATAQSNIKTSLGAQTATFFDYDNDGLLDLYIGYYGSLLAKDGQQPVVDGMNGRPNVLYRNLGKGRFEDVTQKTGVGSTGWTLAVSSLDVDKNGTMDLWLANDFGFDQLYLNQGNGTFKEVAQKAETNDRGSGMNVSFTDINGDGYWDVYISVIDMFSKSIRFVLPQPKSLINIDQRILQTSFYLSGNKFFVSKGKSKYKAQEHRFFEPGYQGWSWAAVFFDYENDGDEDMYLANGWRKDAIAAHQRNRLFLQDKRYFYLHPGPSPALYKGHSRSVAAVDLAGRGKLDLVLNDLETGPKILKNTSSYKNSWLQVRLHGVSSNSFGIGATVVVETDKQVPQQKQVTCGLNYLSQHDTTLTFGLGATSKVKRVVVRWPNGVQQIVSGPIHRNQILTIRERNSQK